MLSIPRSIACYLIAESYLLDCETIHWATTCHTIHGMLQHYRIKSELSSKWTTTWIDRTISAGVRQSRKWFIGQPVSISIADTTLLRKLDQLPTCLRRIRFMNNFLIDLSFTPFLSTFKWPLSLTELSMERSLSSKRLRLLDAEQYRLRATLVAHALKQVKSLATVNLDSNPLGEHGLMGMVMEAVSHHNSLTDLDLTRNQFGSIGAGGIADAIQHSGRMTRLRLGFNGFGPVGAISIADALKLSPRVTWLDLSRNEIGDIGARAISGACHECPNLTYLNLSGNEISKKGAVLIGDAIKHSKSMTTIDLSFNQLGSIGVTSIVDGMKQSTTITQVNLSGNQIDRAGLKAIADAIRCKTLTSLDLSENGLRSEIGLIVDAIKGNESITNLDLKMNYLRDRGATLISDAIAHSSSLKSINLIGNQISRIGTASIIDAIKQSRTITSVDLRRNGLESDVTVMARIGDALKQRATLSV